MRDRNEYADVFVSGGADVDITVNISQDKLQELWEEEHNGYCRLGCGNPVTSEHKICTTCLLEELIGYGPDVEKDVKEIYCE